MADAAFLALDLGTSELKAGLVSATGDVLAERAAAYATDFDATTGRAEQDPEAWWVAITDAVRGIVAGVASAGSGAVDAICVVGQGPTLVAAAGDGSPTRPAITWLDTRPTPDRAALEAATGIGGWGLGVAPAARLVERTEAAVAARTRWYLDSWDWVALRLTGRAGASRARGQAWPDTPAVGAAGVPAGKLPDRVAAGSVLGTLQPRAAAALGLRPGIPVVAGCVDAYAAFFGSGLEAPGDAIDTGGTSGGLGVYWGARVEVADTFAIEAPLPDRWLYGGAMSATGRAFEWLAGNVLGAEAPDLEVEAARVVPGADGLVFLPYLAGERSPIWDPLARGTFAGLTLGHGRGHLARAVLEAAAFALRHVATPIRHAGIELREVRVSGGTARSALWNRIKADVLQVPVAVPRHVDTAMVGAAVIAAAGVRASGSPRSGASTSAELVDAMHAIVHVRERIVPDPAAAAAYDAAFERYRALYPALRPVMHALHDRAGA
ncbi:MAG TPA: FGGY-family carbohydrate kinase [Candidatus Limnocylindrales bacterium]|nr:FGGY-family carbohydrate kinase [Candidatus Limnocylindrales bacterium]